MMTPFDTNLMNYRAQNLQLPTQAERAAARLTAKPRSARRRTFARWLALTLASARRHPAPSPLRSPSCIRDL